MESPSSLEASSVTKNNALAPSVGSSSKQPAASASPVLIYRLGTAAMVSPNFDATVEASRDEAIPSTPSAHVSSETLSSEDTNHDDSDAAFSTFSATHALVGGGNYSDSASSSVEASNSNAVSVPVLPKARAPNKTLGKRVRADSKASSANSNGAAVVPSKKRARSNALMRSAPRATSITTPGGLAGNSEFMYAYSSHLLIYTKTQI